MSFLRSSQRFASNLARKPTKLPKASTNNSVFEESLRKDPALRARWKTFQKEASAVGLKGDVVAMQFRRVEEKKREENLSRKLILGEKEEPKPAPTVKVKATPQTAAQDAQTEQIMRALEVNHIEVNPQAITRNLPYNIFSLPKWTWKAMVDQAFINLVNRFLNFQAFYMLALENVHPDIDTSRSGVLDNYILWPWKSLFAYSTRPTAWSAPYRKIALDVYTRLNTAIAHKDNVSIALLSRDPYRKSIPPLVGGGHSYNWKLHKEVTPARLMSIRAVQGHFSTKEEPKSRNVVEMVVRFDTEQSMEIYAKDGRPLHEIDPDTPRQGKQIPAKRQRVIEYLIIHKRLWDPEGWMVKDQLWPLVGYKVLKS